MQLRNIEISTFCTNVADQKYRIRPNCCTVCLGFSKLLGKRGKICMHLYKVYTLKKGRYEEDFMRSIFYDSNAIFFFLIFFIKAYRVWYSSEFPQLVEEIQMRTNNIRFYK